MFYYWFAIILAVLGCFLHKSKIGSVISWLCLFYMMILTGFRGLSVGTDTINYYNSFYVEGHSTDFVWEFLKVGIQGLNLDYHSFLVLVAFLTYGVFGFVLKKTIPSYLVPFAVLLFIVAGNQYFIQTMNAMRQILATMFLLLVYYLIYVNKFKSAIVVYIISAGLHASSIIYLPFVLCAYFISFSRRTVNLILIISVVYAFFMSNINISAIGYQLIMAVSFLDLEYYADYFDSDNYSAGFSIVGMMTLIPLRCLAASFVYKVLNGNFFARVYFIGVVSLCILAPVFYFAPRALMGLIACELIAIPMAMNTKIYGREAKPYYKYFYYFYMLFYGYMLARGLAGDYILPENLGAYSFY